MYRVTVPEGYAPSLGLYETQKAIGLIKMFSSSKSAPHCT